MEPVVDHIQITVADLRRAERFYDKFLPLLGFRLEDKSSANIEDHEFQVIEYSHPRLAFAVTSPRRQFAGDPVHRRRPGALHHIAFKAASVLEVDRIYGELANIGATIVSPPRIYPEYKPAPYYALFFKDPDGIKFEIVCAGHL